MMRPPTRVLIVDDDAFALDSLRRLLTREGFSVVAFANPVEALTHLASHSYDVVISDERMPGMLGTEFIRRVREVDRTSYRIMLTGATDMEVALAAINDGEIYRFFSKPCEPAMIATAIRRAHKEKLLLDEARRLLALSRTQAALLMELEEAPEADDPVHDNRRGGILEVNPEDLPDLDSLLAELEHETERMERRLAPPGDG